MAARRPHTTYLKYQMKICGLFGDLQRSGEDRLSAPFRCLTHGDFATAIRKARRLIFLDIANGGPPSSRAAMCRFYWA
jgi:hypothetical protein